MKNTCLTSMMVAVLCAAGVTQAGQPDPLTDRSSKPAQPETIQLDIHLRDGSLLVGTPAIATLPLQTPYAKVEVPLRLVKTIEFADDRETVTIACADGDILTGVLNLDGLKLATAFAKLDIPLKEVKSIARHGQDVGAGLILRYSFDKIVDGKVPDLSGKGHDGRTMRGNFDSEFGPGRYRRQTAPNRTGDGLFHFNGIDDVISAGDLGYQPQGTVSFWMKADAVENYRNVLSMDYTHMDQAFRFEEASSGEFGVGLGPMGGRLFTSELQPNKWYHVAFAWTADHFTGWLDGKQTFSEAHDNRLSFQFNNVVIGAGYSGDSRRHWKGFVQDFRIYNRVLSTDEIRSLKDQRP